MLDEAERLKHKTVADKRMFGSAVTTQASRVSYRAVGAVDQHNC